jgi:tRNA G46 methylase TrmB
VALWALGFVRASVQARTGGCGSGSSLTKKAKNKAEGDDDFLDMNVFEKLMEGKQQMLVNENNDDLKSINDTNTFDYSIQNKNTLESINHNNYSDDYD